MKRSKLRYLNGFHVALGNERSQCATMVVPAGGCEGGPNNQHKGADQWLVIVQGRGEAVINGHVYPLSENAVILIERGDTHEIRNTGSAPLLTLNFYVPPAYERGGEELPAGKA